ncbi:MAG: glycosyltransferase [Candidatus Eisenbacteria bacterium]
MAGQGLRCTAIVPTLDRPTDLEACLRSLQASNPGFEAVIVADQGATPVLRSLVEGLGAHYLHLQQRGLSRARNAALALASTPWCYFPDDDCTIAPGVLAEVGAALVRNPQACFAAARVLTPEGQAVLGGMGEREHMLATPQAALDTVMSPGLFVATRTLQACGGFDERFGVGAIWPSGEESDLLFRVLAAGEAGVYVPSALVTHPDPYAVRDEADQRRRARRYGRGWGALFAKHAALPGGQVYARMQRRFELRALGGAVLSLLTLQPNLAVRRWQSWRGRCEGWKGWRAQEQQGGA